jgi:hypothetical protein
MRGRIILRTSPVQILRSSPRIHRHIITACYSSIVGDTPKLVSREIERSERSTDWRFLRRRGVLQLQLQGAHSHRFGRCLARVPCLEVARFGGIARALSPMVSAVIMAIVKAYSSGAAMGGPRLPGLLYMLGAFWWFASSSAGVRQSVLLAGLRAGLVSTIISASVVAGTEVATQKDLTCLVWEKGRGCQQILPSNQPFDHSAGALRGGPNSAGVAGGRLALLAASMLVGSGILSVAILRRRP